MAKILENLGLNRPELRAWAMYDWANSAFVTTVAAVMLPIYYADVAAADLDKHLRTAYWAYTSGIALLIVTVCAPLLGAISDYMGARKRFLAGFLMLGVLTTVGLYFVQRGDWLLASVLFVGGTIGFAGGNVFWESLLPHVASDEEVDRVSTASYAIGYIGGGLLLVVNLLWFLYPAWFGISGKGLAVRLAFLSVAVWWALFSIPTFLYVREPTGAEHKVPGSLVAIAFGRIMETFRQMRRLRHAFIFLVAFWLYNDGIGTIIKMATIYGREIGIGQTSLIGAMVLVQFLGVPCTFLFAPLSGRLGAKACILLCIGVYACISVLGFFMDSAEEFWMLAVGVALVQGGSQALSRSLYASMIPKQQSAEFFAFFSVSAKFAGVFGPLIFGAVAQIFGGSRYSILLLVVFFALGAFLLWQVDPEEGKKNALALEPGR